MTNRVPDGVEERLQYRIAKHGETVVDPQTVFSGTDESGPSQVGQVPRGLRLRDVQALVDVTDADLAVHQEAENAQARRIGERLEQRVEGGQPGVHRSHYIRIDRYVWRRYPSDIFV